MDTAREQYFHALLDHPSDTDALRHRKINMFDTAEPPHRLYKFCSIDTALKILDSKSVLLQQPESFNDPFDCLSGVGIWQAEGRFGPNDDEIARVKEILSHIPEKFKMPQYEIPSDLRASYCFSISCFTSNPYNPLMWSHYASNHRGVCIEFDVSDMLDELHPCYYAARMPILSWQSNNINLSLIKGDAWVYEQEWRFVRKTIRPIMRIVSSVTHNIYNSIHSNAAHSKQDHVEWSDWQAATYLSLEREYNEQRMVPVKPSRVYVGLKYEHNYANTKTADTCRRITSIARKCGLPIHEVLATPSSFRLHDTALNDLPPWF